MEKKQGRFIYQNYRIKLHNLREDQKYRILELSYARRFLYNWALEYCNEEYLKTGKTPPYQAVARVFTKLKKSDPRFTWLDDPRYNVTTCRYAFIDLAHAFNNFIIGKCRHPIFKDRKTDSIRFAVRSDTLTFKGEDGRFAFIPGISMRKGDLIDCGNHNIPHGKNVKYENARIKFDGNDYWLSLSIRMEMPFYYDDDYHLPGEVIGIDVGIRTAATLSNGITFDGPDKHRLNILDNRLRKIQSAVDRDRRRRQKLADSTRTKYYDIPKSKNQVKREFKLAKTRNRIANIYRSAYHKIASDIVDMRPSTVVVETLGVARMVSNATGKQLRNALYQGRLATLSEYISYKCEQNYIRVIHADKEYPSSQICSCCGSRYEIGRDKIYSCPVCGMNMDRDLNAAINLRNYGMTQMFGQNWQNINM